MNYMYDDVSDIMIIILGTSIHDLSKHKDSRKHKQRYQLHLSFIHALQKEDIGREVKVGVGGGTHDDNDDPTTVLY